MKILLTGGSGFIGRNIRESFLNEKHEIIAPPHKELDCADDNSVENYFRLNSFDAVIHSATKPGHRNAPDVHNLFFVNSRMLLNLLKHKDSWGKLITLGSGAIYDMAHYQHKMKEEYFGIHIPHDEHGYNKYISGLLMPHYKNTTDLIIFGIFGKYEDYAIRFISNAICKTLLGLPITIRQNRRFDYLYVNDLMPVLDYFLLNSAKYPKYNVTPDDSVELLEIAQIIIKISGKAGEIIVANPGMGTDYSGDIGRLKSEIAGIKFTSLVTAIEQLYNWYKSNLHLIKKEALLVDK